jgi:hypothetical protein
MSGNLHSTHNSIQDDSRAGSGCALLHIVTGIGVAVFAIGIGLVIAFFAVDSVERSAPVVEVVVIEESIPTEELDEPIESTSSLQVLQISVASLTVDQQRVAISRPGSQSRIIEEFVTHSTTTYVR